VASRHCGVRRSGPSKPRAAPIQVDVTTPNRGIGVIVISSDMLELRRCATRIICLNSGRIQGEYDSRTTSNEELVTAIFGKARETA
jgi:ABC-type uncharacterized transport system ATPase subunit